MYEGLVPPAGDVVPERVRSTAQCHVSFERPYQSLSFARVYVSERMRFPLKDMAP